MPREHAANFDALADHILTELERWESGAPSGEPNGRVLGVARLLAVCFGPDSAEAIAFDVITSLEEFVDVETDQRGAVSREERATYLAGLLRQEYSE